METHICLFRGFGSRVDDYPYRWILAVPKST